MSITGYILSFVLSQPADCLLVMPKEISCWDRTDYTVYARLGGVEWLPNGHPASESIGTILRCDACFGPAAPQTYRKTTRTEFCLGFTGGIKVQPGGVGWEVGQSLDWCWVDEEFFERTLCCPERTRAQGTVLVRHERGMLKTFVDYSASGTYEWNWDRCPDLDINRASPDALRYKRHFDCGSEMREQPYDKPIYIWQTAWLCCPDSNPNTPSNIDGESKPTLGGENDQIDHCGGFGSPNPPPCNAEDISDPHLPSGTIGSIQKAVLLTALASVPEDGEWLDPEVEHPFEVFSAARSFYDAEFYYECIMVCKDLVQKYPESAEYHAALILMNDAAYVSRTDDWNYLDFVKEMCGSIETSFPLILRLNMRANDWLSSDSTVLQAATLFNEVADYMDNTLPMVTHLPDYQWARTSCAYACVRSNQTREAQKQIDLLEGAQILPQYDLHYTKVLEGIEYQTNLSVKVKNDTKRNVDKARSTRYNPTTPLSVGYAGNVPPARTRIQYAEVDTNRDISWWINTFAMASLFLILLHYWYRRWR